MTFTALDAFEEIRFILELLVAELIFLVPFAPSKKRININAPLALIGYSFLSLLYFPILNTVEGTSFVNAVVCAWYILLTISTLLFCRSLFEINIVDSLYIVITAFVTQHLVYVIVHEALALYYWTFLVNHLFIYGVFSILCCMIWYLFIYMVFARKLSLAGGNLYENRQFMIFFYIIFLAITMISTFSAQHIFRVGGDVLIYGILWGLFTCMLVLGIQYANFRSTLAVKEQAIIERMLHDSASHYEISRELIDLVNRSAHDMKHHLRALRTASDEERERYFEENMAHIEEYQRLVFCDNEVLNTILAEKSLYCNSNDITFSCSVKKANLDFIDVTDLYALLGNAIDNAIECVSAFEDPTLRAISLNVSSRDAFTTIQIENYSGKTDSVSDLLPATTKEGPGHGFGLKSIRYIANKYDGSMSWNNKDGVFSLQILFPVPVMP